MTRSLIAAGCLTLVLLSAGCGDDDGDATTGTDGTSDSTSESDLPRGASVADFCAALADVDDAIDEADPDSDEDWERVVAGFDALGALGVPDDLPEPAVEEIAHLERLVRASDSTAELAAAVEADPPESRAVDAYIDDSCE